MVSTPPLVRTQLSEALSVVSSYEFPGKWPTLLPDLISRLESGDASTVHGVLETANSIYKRYRNQFMSTALSDELSYSQQFVQPLLKSLQVRLFMLILSSNALYYCMHATCIKNVEGTAHNHEKYDLCCSASRSRSKHPQETLAS